MRFVEEFIKEPRAASIYQGEQGYMVLFFLGDQWIETRDVSNHSIEYAQACAWNWTEGIIP